jgi:hypothetical protein
MNRLPRKQLEFLPVKLTQAELITKGKELAEETQKLEQTEEEKKLAMDSFKERIQSHQHRIKNLAHLVDTGEEKREVEVFERKCYAERIMETFRKDTGECIRTRPLNEDEYQENLLETASEAVAA